MRVEQRNVEQTAIQENEVRIMAAGKMRNYISYATALVTVCHLRAFSDSRWTNLCKQSPASVACCVW